MSNKAKESQHNNHDVKQLALDILRDLYSASRKLMMYPIGHPVAGDTIKKPMTNLSELFKYKSTLNLQVYNKRIVAEGILLEDNVFTNGMVYDFAKHNIESVVFKHDITAEDLCHFFKKLIENKNPLPDYVKRYLEAQDINTIIINDSISTTLYSLDDTLIGTQISEYNINKRIVEIILKNHEAILAYYNGAIQDDAEVKEYLGIDLRYYSLKDIFPQVMAKMSEEQALALFQKAIYSANWLDELVDDNKLTGLRRLWQDYAAKSEDISILLPVYNVFKSVGITEEIMERIFDRGALIKLKAVRDAESFIESIKRSKVKDISFEHLRKTVFKLATDSYSSPLEKLLTELLKGLSADLLDTRQRCLRLSMEALQTLTDSSFTEIASAFTREILRLIHKPSSGNEIVELVSWIVENSAGRSNWQEVKVCLQTLRGLAGLKNDTRAPKALNQLSELVNSSVLTDILTDAVIGGKGDSDLIEALAALRSPNIANQLLDKIDYDDKAVRARVIKALITMGRDVGPDVVSRLASIVGQGETDDDFAWYKLRNLMRVLGQIGYIEALPYYEVMAGWDQKRLKHEIIASCEDMTSAAVGVVLAKLALDKDQEIRKSAVIAMGSGGTRDHLKFMRALFDDPRAERVTIVETLGRIGGPKARDILIDLYEDGSIYKNLGIPSKEEEQIKVAILRGLSKIADDIAKSRMELYSTQKKGGFLKKDVLSKTATILLEKIK